MRLFVAGKDGKANRILENRLKREGIGISRINPDIIICHGGDGTFLYNERKFPGIPKILLRGKNLCRLCGHMTIRNMVMSLKKGRYRIKEMPKLEARLGKKRLIAANDIVIRNRHPARALRFSVFVNGMRIGKVHIGDGIVVSTPFGSTGYFRSITRDSFTRGIGIAFNNTVDIVGHMVLKDDAKIRIRAERDAAYVSHDNETRLNVLRMGESITIRQSKEKKRIVLLQ